MKTWNGISVTLRTTVGPQCDVIHNNFAFGVGVDLHLHRVHFLVCFRSFVVFCRFALTVFVLCGWFFSPICLVSLYIYHFTFFKLLVWIEILIWFSKNLWTSSLDIQNICFKVSLTLLFFIQLRVFLQNQRRSLISDGVSPSPPLRPKGGRF